MINTNTENFFLNILCPELTESKVNNLPDAGEQRYDSFKFSSKEEVRKGLSHGEGLQWFEREDTSVKPHLNPSNAQQGTLPST